MNSVLREWLDDFVTAYLDDVLIYSSGSKADHEAKVRRVLQALADAGLHLDPAKCEFSVQEQRAIREWEAPTTVKGVRSFLGFANYYRIFIPDYAKITQSLDALLKKGTAFHWGRAENEAFQELKRRFCESPVLKQWDPSLPTFLETDCSGYALGGVLSQEGPDGRRHACAFFSKRLSPAEYNYPIHDKEMLAIMRCLDNWNAELRSCGPFTILTDHRNLEASTLPKMKVFEVADLQQLWDETVAKDSIFRAAYKAVRDRERAFPPSLGLKIQISECAIDAGKRLTFRDRIWSHDSVATGHPGREGTLAIVARRFYWPGQSQLVCRDVANCDTRGRAHIWRQSKGNFQASADSRSTRSHLSMDFITDLPPTGPSKARYLWVIVDRLTKAVTLEVMDNMEAEPCANRFLQCHYRFHGMPRSIVSDRGSNWLSRFWKRFCRLAGVTQKLSTAYHPQTDGGPERMNQEIEAYLRAYVSYVQDDWGELLPAAQLALNNRESAATKISPFSLSMVTTSIPSASRNRKSHRGIERKAELIAYSVACRRSMSTCKQ
ncbi:integrase core domain-containing protein [Hirsutella rhossiliensis]|uniref:Integrase core domain-containing protein n=1 Tax=Hirsutella rhossiliensis TaxID=111463 RepID=A0A9P8SMR9_9HYPO|nr:integrase core domain-containing protein [Hirsutella rhossiliensis]KAH0966426.1 integrase core domain-containing protein [Hirsutella rhossiliensis]